MYKLLLASLFTVLLLTGNISQAETVPFHYTQYDKDIKFIDGTLDSLIRCWAIVTALKDDVDVAVLLTTGTNAHAKLKKLSKQLSDFKEQNDEFLAMVRFIWGQARGLNEQQAFDHTYNRVERAYLDLQAHKWRSTGGNWVKQTMTIRDKCIPDVNGPLKEEFQKFIDGKTKQ